MLTLSATIVEIVQPATVLQLADVFGPDAVTGAIQNALARQQVVEGRSHERLAELEAQQAADDYDEIDRLMRQRAHGALGSAV